MLIELDPCCTMVKNATLQPLTEVFFFPYIQNTEVHEQ
jgi:hypothetical protein